MPTTWRNAKNVARVRKMRKSEKLPIAQIAQKLGVSRNTVYASLRVGTQKASVVSKRKRRKGKA